MKVLIRNAEIINHGSRHHLKKRNVIVENGKIGFIGSKMPEADKVVKGDDLKVSAGWFDMNVLFGDPGYEYKEDLKSGLSAASNGGFTGIGLLPNTQPAIQTKNDLAYIKSENQTSITQIFPYAAVTRDVKGEDLTDMIDLDNAGATAFTDGVKPIWKSDILLKTLQYLQKFNGLLINRPEDLNLNLFGNMHEGKTSTILGMKGMPSISEEIMIARDIRLLEYAGG
ncbi:MAG: dihydroorotase, partial [Bacteroidetes bacterium]